MFNKIIHSTTLSSEIADKLFSNITDSSVLDKSFLSTLRAILRKRLPQDKNVRLTCKEISIHPDNLARTSAVQYMNEFIPGYLSYPPPSDYNIHIVYGSNQDIGQKILEMVQANAGANKRFLSNYTKQEDLKVFYAAQARRVNALFYSNNNKQNIVIFAEVLDIRQFHVLQMMLFKYFPSLFAENPLNDTEKALLKSTGGMSSAEYESLIESFAKELDIRAEIIRSQLEGFESVFERVRIKEIQDEIQNHQHQYASHLDSLRSLTMKIDDCQWMLMGLEETIEKQTESSELMEYFMCNKNLSISKVVGMTLEFVAHGYMDVYDAEAFEHYVENYKSNLYASLNPDISKPQLTPIEAIRKLEGSDA